MVSIGGKASNVPLAELVRSAKVVDVPAPGTTIRRVKETAVRFPGLFSSHDGIALVGLSMLRHKRRHPRSCALQFPAPVFPERTHALR
jgi:hypothetical protein